VGSHASHPAHAPAARRESARVQAHLQDFGGADRTPREAASGDAPPGSAPDLGSGGVTHSTSPERRRGYEIRPPGWHAEPALAIPEEPLG